LSQHSNLTTTRRSRVFKEEQLSALETVLTSILPHFCGIRHVALQYRVFLHNFVLDLCHIAKK